MKACKIVALALYLVFAAAACGAKTCTPFKYVNQRIVVQAKINGYGPFNLLLDTGTQTTIIDPKVYAQVGGTMLAKASIGGMGVSRSASYAQVTSIQIAGHEDVFFKVMISDLSSLQNDRSSVTNVGILGQNLLEQFTVTIDYQHSCLTLQ